MLAQPKYQTRPLPSEAEPTQWASDAGARKPKAPSNFGVGTDGQRGGRLNRMPPGSDNGKADLPRVMSGASDVSKDWNRESVEKGYKRLATKSGTTEDIPVPFYGDAVADGAHGFIERMNVEDRA